MAHPRGGAAAIALLASSAACPARAPAPPPPATDVPLAITIDDLPFVGPTPGARTSSAALGRIAAALTARAAPATGFVVCGQAGAELAADLRPWLDAELDVGNHSSTHRAFDALPLDAWIDDVRACRDQLAALTGAPPRYFRYPYLQTGAKRAERDAGLRALEALDQTRAPVTIDTSEWALAGPYAKARAAGDLARTAEIAEAYVAHVVDAARHYRAVAWRRYGRDVRQVLLLHANALAADHLGRLLDALAREGFRFVSLQQALEDPVFARKDDWVDPVGASWLYRTTPADRAAWRWDQAQHQALEARFVEP